jgi:uncharacterized membrane protein YjjB (DUF3815 family)
VDILPAIAAATGSLLACLDPPSRRLRGLLLLASAGVLVPLEQARIHTLTSLNKHVDLGAWFAAVAAGYAADLVIRWTRFRSAQLTATTACICVLVPGNYSAWSDRGW